MNTTATAPALFFSALCCGETFVERGAFDAHQRSTHPRGIKITHEIQGWSRGKRVTKTIVDAETGPRYSAPAKPRGTCSPLTAEERAWVGRTVALPGIGGRRGQVWSLAPKGYLWVVLDGEAVRLHPERDSLTVVGECFEELELIAA